MPEQYESVKHLFELIKVNEVKCVYAADMKMANIVFGLQNHASTYPCTWCTASKNELNLCGTPRTLGHIIQESNNYSDHGSIK